MKTLLDGFSESEFVWEVPLRFKVLLFRLQSYLNKCAISFVLWWNSLNKTEQNSHFALFPMQPYGEVKIRGFV
jgi:hypothetical protein